MQTRQNKIRLLKGIARGIVKVDSLKPQPFLLKMDLGEGNIRYSIDRKGCTLAEYEAESARNPKSKIAHVTLVL